ncbi:MAG: tRNA (adenosine(37)-N6)-threonylcarbamoyltransferase complex transferase subunit TsaD [Candidatus Magasanikbacteria bacterium CG_4_10_14_0_8_um_filter_32_14]|uniref:tRNA N6-adenosine threonylcarbamoyltransferase n=1 Tax=Candidatus Magasanikbacteria bacterium CG_4_10_14_0_8_um_filter_32_14 TaxID=1974640 RepID=A0A2M7RA88_9BACT|nr:MAG: tRNA (adenosine(37)-N6)-threonylcarbamoyltransferase complex transferase subunit TsaD [Candidatus Magasanikbacteria bacterium CG_4_10_14_0_8_um_filter_32_14]
MKILGIESSCDDTSISLIEITDNKIKILAEKTASQIDVHKKYGGVVPEIAGRKHAEVITPLVDEIMANFAKPNTIAVTAGPGLITGLLVGVETAKSLSYLWNVPLVAINHIEGHINSVKLNIKDEQTPILTFPLLALVVSGGHTELLLSKQENEYEKIGGTRDDAVGEAFDKIAKIIGLDYPGGPKISKYAQDGNPQTIKFPRPMMDSNDYDMSFSGLKTASLYWLQDNTKKTKNNTFKLKPQILNDFCASFEQAIVDVLVEKTTRAVKQYNPKSVLLVGGVSANIKLRETLKNTIEQIPNTKFFLSALKYSMDNAAMIAVASYNYAKQSKFTDWKEIKADPNWKVYNKQI